MRARTPGAHYKDFQVIISKTVEIKIRNRSKYWTEILGYEVGYHDVVNVPLSKMPSDNNKKVLCECDECKTQFERGLQLINKAESHLCYECARKDVGKKNVEIQSEKPRISQRGENHPRWKGNRKEFDVYAQRVHALTRSASLKKIWSTWENADKIGLCGVEGAYQLDHKVSIKYGFYNHIPAELIASINNLEIITWEDNRGKSGGNSLDLWNLLS